MPGPVLLAVDDDPDALREVESQLQERYSRDYTVVCEDSPDAALNTLEKLAEEGAEVALVLAALPRPSGRGHRQPGGSHGAVKRVASAVGDGSIAIQLVHRPVATDRLHPASAPRETDTSLSSPRR
jgi:CheY-like chemotaxis protein